MQLDVGPIRYIAELFYGVEENATKNIEAAVRIFTLLIVSTLDPLAVILLVAANHTLLRLRNEKEKTIPPSGSDGSSSDANIPAVGEEVSKTPDQDAYSSIKDNAAQIRNPVPAPSAETKEKEIHVPILPASVELLNEETDTTTEEVAEVENILLNPVSLTTSPGQIDPHEDTLDIIREVLENQPTASTNTNEAEALPEINNEEIKAILEKISENRRSALPLSIVRQPNPTQVSRNKEPVEPSEIKAVDASVPQVAQLDDSITRELRGNTPHFIPQKVNEEEKPREEKTEVVEENTPPTSVREKITSRQPQNDKYPKALSWLAEFKRS